MPVSITFIIGSRRQRIEAEPHRSLLNNFLAQGVPIDTRCGGKAICGRCRIRIIAGGERLTPVREAEARRLGPELLADNWRLACQCYSFGDLEVEIPARE